MPEWIKFILEVIPPRSKKSGSTNIKGMRNRNKKDEIDPGGKNYPDIADEKDRYFEWHEKAADFLLYLNINHGQATSIQAQGLYDAMVLTDEEAKVMKEGVFDISPPEGNGAS